MANQQDQNPYLITGPFEAAIQPQTYQSTAPPTVSGYGGRAEGVAMLSDKFLEGFSRGRAQAFQRQELQRAKLQQDVDKANERLENAYRKGDITKEAYDQAAGKLDGLRLMAVRNEVDKSKDKNHPQLKFLKNAFDALVGPAPKKYEFGPQQVYSTLNDVYDTLHATSSSGPAAVEKATQDLSVAIGKATQPATQRPLPGGGFSLNAAEIGNVDDGIKATQAGENYSRIQTHNKSDSPEKFGVLGPQSLTQAAATPEPLTSQRVMSDPNIMGPLNKIIALTPPGRPLPPSVQMFVKQVEQTDKEEADIRALQQQFDLQDRQVARTASTKMTAFRSLMGRDPDDREKRDIVDSALGIKTRLTANSQLGDIELTSGQKVQGYSDPRDPGSYTNLAGDPIDPRTVKGFTPQTKQPPLSSAVRDENWARDVKAHPDQHSPEEVKTADSIISKVQNQAKNLELTVEQKQERVKQLRDEMATTQQIKPESIDLGANLYLQTGQMPNFGLSGGAAGLLRTKIFNRAGEIAASNGDDAASITAKRAAITAGRSALTALDRQKNLTLAFEKTANKSMDLALQRSNEVDRSGSTLLNRWTLYKEGQLKSSPEILRFNNDVETAANEYAKVITGQTGGAAVSDAARAQTGKMLSAAYSQDAFAAIVADMRKDMKFREQGFGEQRQELLDEIQGAGRPQAQQTTPPPGGATPDLKNMSTEDLLKMATGGK